MPIAVLVRRVPPRRHGLVEPAPLSELWPRRLRRRLARRPCRPALRRDRPSHRRRGRLPPGGPLVLRPRTTGLTPTPSARSDVRTRLDQDIAGHCAYPPELLCWGRPPPT